MRKTPTLVLATLLLLCAPAAALAQGAATDSSATSATTAEAPEAVVCTGVEERAPVGASGRFDAGTAQLYCFTRITGAAGTKVTHAWIHEGTTRARVQLEVGSDDWRTWSSKRIAPGWTGDWEVKVLGSQGEVLATVPFRIGPPAEGGQQG